MLGNVFRYTPEGTRFAVTLVHQADLVALVVEDACPGIANVEHAKTLATGNVSPALIMATLLRDLGAHLS